MGRCALRSGLLQNGSEAQQLISKHARAQPTHLMLLAVVQDEHVGPAVHWRDALNRRHAHNGAAGKANELRRVEPRFQILQTIGDREVLVAPRLQMQELAVGDDRYDLIDRYEKDVILLAN